MKLEHQTETFTVGLTLTNEGLDALGTYLARRIPDLVVHIPESYSSAGVVIFKDKPYSLVPRRFETITNLDPTMDELPTAVLDELLAVFRKKSFLIIGGLRADVSAIPDPITYHKHVYWMIQYYSED